MIHTLLRQDMSRKQQQPHRPAGVAKLIWPRNREGLTCAPANSQGRRGSGGEGSQPAPERPSSANMTTGAGMPTAARAPGSANGRVQTDGVALTKVCVVAHPADGFDGHQLQQSRAHERAHAREEEEQAHYGALHGLGGGRIGEF